LRLLPLMAMEVAAFLLIIVETYAFFNVVVPIGQFPHNLGEYTGYALLKALLTLGLGLVWFLVMLGMTRAYVRSKLRNPTPIPSS
jgi:hypothetical protein